MKITRKYLFLLITLAAIFSTFLTSFEAYATTRSERHSYTYQTMEANDRNLIGVISFDVTPRGHWLGNSGTVFSYIWETPRKIKYQLWYVPGLSYVYNRRVGGLETVIRENHSIISGLSENNMNRKEAETGFRSYGLKPRAHFLECNAETRFYQVKIDGVGFVSPGYSSPVLFNRMGRKYPNHQDPFSGKQIPNADPTWVKVPDPLPRLYGLRDRYIAYLEQTYFHSKAQGDDFWKKYQLHHIRPLSLGGTHSFDNLAMLLSPVHAEYTGWFGGF